MIQKLSEVTSAYEGQKKMPTFKPTAIRSVTTLYEKMEKMEELER